MKKRKEGSSVVKIDPELLERVEEFLNLEENKFKFVNKKQFIDIAVFEYLKSSDKEGSKK